MRVLVLDIIENKKPFAQQSGTLALESRTSPNTRHRFDSFSNLVAKYEVCYHQSILNLEKLRFLPRFATSW